MRRDITSWYSHRLGEEMPIVAYGHAGLPLLMLPTAAADFLEYERFHLVGSIAPFIEAGKVRAYSVNSVNRRSLLNDGTPPALKMELQARYDSYLIEEVLPFIRSDMGNPSALPVVMGISLGAYLAANTFFKHPDQYAGGIFLGGSYDVRSYLHGYWDDTVYFNNPVSYLPNLGEGHHLSILQGGTRPIIIFSGQGAYEAPDRSRQLSEILHSKGVPHWLDIWGHDVDHDWPWWRKALPYYLGTLVGNP